MSNHPTGKEEHDFPEFLINEAPIPTPHGTHPLIEKLIIVINWNDFQNATNT